MLLSALKVGLVALDTVVVAPVVVAIALFDERAAYRACQVWVRIALRICGVRVRSRRLAPLDPAAAYVFMSNHRSQYDILGLVMALQDIQLRWVTKKELTRVPVFGWAVRRAGHIIIDRSDSRQAVASLRAAREQMLRGISVMIFPEGTRSAAGQVLLPLKKGGFMLALETGFPIVPVVVRGSRQLLPRGSWHPRPGEIEVIVGTPIPVAGMQREELMRRVEAFMLEHLEPGVAAADTVTAVAM